MEEPEEDEGAEAIDPAEVGCQDMCPLVLILAHKIELYGDESCLAGFCGSIHAAVTRACCTAAHRERVMLRRAGAAL